MLAVSYFYVTHCLKLKMNDKKLSRFQFHFPGLLGCQNIYPIIEKKSFLVLTSGKFLEALESGIGTGSVFCHSFSVSNNVYFFSCIAYALITILFDFFHSLYFRSQLNGRIVYWHIQSHFTNIYNQSKELRQFTI